MNQISYKLPKEERLCNKISIGKLFTTGESFIAYPFRVVYNFIDDQEVPASMFISVPKRHFKRAVHRNQIRRRSREAYRLNKHNLISVLNKENKKIEFAIIYLDKEIEEYNKLEPKMQKVIEKLIKIATNGND